MIAPSKRLLSAVAGLVLGALLDFEKTKTSRPIRDVLGIAFALVTCLLGWWLDAWDIVFGITFVLALGMLWRDWFKKGPSK